MHPPPKIAIVTGKLEVLTSGSIVFDPADGVSISVGALTIRLEFKDGETEVVGGKPSTKRTPDSETLTLRYEFSGKLPCSPMSYFSVGPQEIGIANGNKVFFAWHVSKLSSSHPSVLLTYTIYREHDAAVSAGSSGKEDGNESNA
jgi:hypothetical protein